MSNETNKLKRNISYGFEHNNDESRIQSVIPTCYPICTKVYGERNM